MPSPSFDYDEKQRMAHETWLAGEGWKTAADRKMMKAILDDSAAGVHAALDQGASVNGEPPVDHASRAMAATRKATWLVHATLDGKANAVAALLEARADPLQPVRIGEPTPVVLKAMGGASFDVAGMYLMLFPFVNAVEPQSPVQHGFGPLALALDYVAEGVDKRAGRERIIETLKRRMPARALTVQEGEAIWTAAASSLSVAGARRVIGTINNNMVRLEDTSEITRQAMLEKVMLVGDTYPESKSRVDQWFEVLAALDTRIPKSPSMAGRSSAIRLRYAEQLVSRHPSAMGVPASMMDPNAPRAHYDLPHGQNNDHTLLMPAEIHPSKRSRGP